MLRLHVFDSPGINQAGSIGDVLFCGNMADIGEFLSKNMGSCIEEILFATYFRQMIPF